MTRRPAALAGALQRLDPAAHEPVPTGARRAAILETALRSTAATTAKRERSAPLRPRSLRRTALTLAFVAVAALALLVPRVGSAPEDARAAVGAAAERTGAVESLRAVLLVRDADGSTARTTASVSGADVHTQTVDRRTGHRESITLLGDRMWTQTGRRISTERASASDRLTPFSEASAAVVAAALRSHAVTDAGRAAVRGIEARRYTIEIDAAARAALAALPPQTLAWFELEYPNEVTRLNVWIADELIRGIRVESPRTTAKVEYFGFGAPVRISPPRR